MGNLDEWALTYPLSSSLSSLSRYSNQSCCDSLSYHTLIDTMLLLTMVVEEKIAAEIKGKKGTIMHE